ncbi:hypothetical protein SAMN05892877_15217, partial [Rhizobium subbaraonis]
DQDIAFAQFAEACLQTRPVITRSGSAILMEMTLNHPDREQGITLQGN